MSRSDGAPGASPPIPTGPTDFTGWRRPALLRLLGAELTGGVKRRPMECAFAILMEPLGYQRYVAQGVEIGPKISPLLGELGPGDVAALHINLLPFGRHQPDGPLEGLSGRTWRWPEVIPVSRGRLRLRPDPVDQRAVTGLFLSGCSVGLTG